MENSTEGDGVEKVKAEKAVAVATSLDSKVDKERILKKENVEDEDEEEIEECEMNETNQNNESRSGDVPSWDHGNRRVIVQNMLKFTKVKEVERAIRSWLDALDDPNSIRITKTRKAPNKPWMHVTLEHEDMVQPFLNHMNSGKFDNGRGSILSAQRAETDRAPHNDDNRKRKANDDDSEQQPERKRQKPSCGRPKTNDQVRDAIIPLWRKSYDQQLDTKQREMVRKCALKIVKEVKSRFKNIEREARRNKNREVVPVYEWMKKERPIDVKPILPSPAQMEYRNKCEVNFGYRYELDDVQNDDNQAQAATEDDVSSDTRPMKAIPSVGFMASGWAGGVARPHILSNIPSEACAIVDVINEFLKDSPTAPYDSKVHRGLWRMVTIRISRRTKECMVIIMHAPPSGGLGAKDETDDFTAVFESEKARLVSMLTGSDLAVTERDYLLVLSDEKAPKAIVHKPPKSFRVTSLYFQEYDGVSSPGPEHPVQHAFGKRAIQEKLGKCTFQISPGAFFQVNTAGAETLYSQVAEKVREVCPNPDETLLFDVCSGTGTIGLTLLKEGVVGRVVGVDMSEPAIADAKINAELNGYGSSNAETDRTRFVAARAEHALAKEMRAVDSTESVVAVVDPSREGLHSDVLRSLRVNRRISRVVYVSCNPTGSLVKDAGVLCAPPTKKYPGRPFCPTSAQPVDMFPMTNHCEMVMTFDRLPEEDRGATKQ